MRGARKQQPQPPRAPVPRTDELLRSALASARATVSDSLAFAERARASSQAVLPPIPAAAPGPAGDGDGDGGGGAASDQPAPMATASAMTTAVFAAVRARSHVLVARLRAQEETIAALHVGMARVMGERQVAIATRGRAETPVTAGDATGSPATGSAGA